MRNILTVLQLLLVLCLFAPVSGMAQRGAEKGAVLSEKERMANTALFVDAVKERLNGNYDRAEEMLHQVILKEPSHDAAHYETAIILTLKGQLHAALQEALLASGLDPENMWYKVMIGDLYNQTGQPEKAEPYWRELSEKNPENLDYLNSYAYSLTRQNKLAKAIKVYDAMQRQIGVNEQLIETKKNIWLYLKKPDAAVAELLPLMEAYPDESAYPVEAAQIYMSAGKEKKAVPYLERALKTDSLNGHLLMLLYNYYSGHKKEREAYECLKKFVGNPNIQMEAKRKLMAVYYQRAQQDTSCYREAGPLLDLLVKTHANDADAWSQRADFLILQQRFDEALSDLERVLSLDSSKSVVWQYYITLLLQRNRVGEAAAAGARAVQLFPTQPVAYFAMAAGAMEDKDFETAVTNLQEARRYVSDNPAFLSDIYRLLAKSYEELGQYSKAEEAENMRRECQRQMEEAAAAGKKRGK
ncbi:MAG: tetratricopeptide repeat protein [Bacteroidales bacterium]|nr:tetratricopeptide repeat protein [Bacteroidales bacterium]